MSISIDLARRVLEAAKQRARELRSPVSIAIVDSGGHLVLFERMMAPYGWATGNISIAKANTSVMFNQSTDSVAQWAGAIPGFSASLAEMTSGKFILAAGGWPIRVNGITIGGIGVSGGNAPGRDDEIAHAGLAVVEGMHAPRPQATYYQPSQPQPAYVAAPVPQPQPPPQPVSVYGNYDNGNGAPKSEQPPAQESITPEHPPTRHLPEDEINPYSNSVFDGEKPTKNADRPGDQS